MNLDSVFSRGTLMPVIFLSVLTFVIVRIVTAARARRRLHQHIETLAGLLAQSGLRDIDAKAMSLIKEIAAIPQGDTRGRRQARERLSKHRSGFRRAMNAQWDLLAVRPAEAQISEEEHDALYALASVFFEVLEPEGGRNNVFVERLLSERHPLVWESCLNLMWFHEPPLSEVLRVVDRWLELPQEIQRHRGLSDGMLGLLDNALVSLDEFPNWKTELFKATRKVLRALKAPGPSLDSSIHDQMNMLAERVEATDESQRVSA